MSADFVWTPLRSGWRWVVATAAVCAALAHIPVIGHHFAEAPYLGVEFIVLTTACALLAVAAVTCDSAAVYALVVLTCGLAIIGYVATRLVAFPLLDHEVGMWWEPFGVVSVLAEAAAVTAGAGGVWRYRRPARAQ